MGKVASDKCHKWVFKEPSECETNISNYWQSSFDALPPEWNGQFDCGIQTIAVIHAGQGLLQLGSCKIIPEDLHFVLRMRHTFESLGYQSGFYLTQLFSSNRNVSGSSCKQQPAIPARPPAPPLLSWTQRQVPASATVSPHGFHGSSALSRHGFSSSKEEPSHRFLSHRLGEEVIVEQENDIKWPHGLSFFNALTGRADDARIVFHSDEIGHKSLESHHHHHGPGLDDASHIQHHIHILGNSIAEDFISPDNHTEGSGNRRSFGMGARISSSASLNTGDHRRRHQTPGEFRSQETG